MKKSHLLATEKSVTSLNFSSSSSLSRCFGIGLQMKKSHLLATLLKKCHILIELELIISLFWLWLTNEKVPSFSYWKMCHLVFKIWLIFSPYWLCLTNEKCHIYCNKAHLTVKVMLIFWLYWPWLTIGTLCVHVYRVYPFKYRYSNVHAGYKAEWLRVVCLPENNSPLDKKDFFRFYR